MSADLKTSTSAIPGVQTGIVLTTAEQPLFTVPAGATWIGKIYVTNTTIETEGGAGSSATAFVSIVKSGGTAGVQRILAANLVAGQTALYEVQLNEGDFISGKSGAASKITVVPDGTLFSNSTGAVLSGIQDDAIGSGGVSTSGPVTGTQGVGSAANRRIYALLTVALGGGFSSWSAYDTLEVKADGVAMSRVVSANFDYGSGPCGSLHIFEKANPTSGVTASLAGNAAKAGLSVPAMFLESFSLSGVGSILATLGTDAPTASQALNLSVSPAAAGQRAIFGATFADPPQRLNRRVRAFDGFPSGFNVPHWSVFADWAATAAGALAMTTQNSSYHTGVAAVLVPA